MDIRRRLGLTIKELRGKKGWSQEELGFETELHRTYISGIERGVRNPTVTVLERLADALGVTPSRLLERSAKQGRRRS
jgi:transcriptional regulator with XRE-family HTH domain